MEGRDDGGGKVMGLIEKATKSTAQEVDPRLLKAIKSIVRYSDSEVRLSAQTLMELMRHNHSQVLFYIRCCSHLYNFLILSIH